jgi:hypothetical protein
MSKKKPRTPVEQSTQATGALRYGAWADLHFCMMLAHAVLAQAGPADGSKVAQWYAIGRIYHA